MQMQNTFAGIKPNWDVCNPITQTMRLLMPEITRPVHIFLPTRTVAQASDFFRYHERHSVAPIAVAQQPLRFFIADNLLRVWIEVYRPA